MVNRWMESWDYLATADIPKRYEVTTIAANVSIGASGRNGTSALHLTHTNAGVAKTLDGQATWYTGFWVKLASIPSGERTLLSFYGTDGTKHVTFAVESTGLIMAYRGNAGAALLATSTFAFTAGVGVYLEFKATISDTVGEVVLKVNGSTDATLNTSSLDTRNGGAAATAAQIELFSGTDQTFNIDIDDWYINDATGGVDDTFWGDVRIIAKSVDGAGNSAQFTPSTGSNWQNVDDATPDGDTTYNESSTVNHIDSMTTAALGVTGTVKGVNLLVYARKTDAGVGTLAPLWRISGTDYPGTGVALPTDYAYVSQLYRVSPATSSAFTTSEIDGAEIGYKRTA